MPKTNFSNKCAILGILHAFYGETDDPTWREFFEWGDLGLPLAYMIHIGAAKPTVEGKAYVDDCWKVFCNMIDIDPEGHYANLGEAFAASNHPPLVE
jgi:hypothetical protein